MRFIAATALSGLCAASPAMAQIAGGRDALMPQDPMASRKLQEVGRCVARLRRAEAMNYLRQEPGSRGERRIRSTMVRQDVDCLKAEGAKDILTFKDPLLRGFIAEGLYLSATSQPIPPKTEGVAPLRAHVFARPDSKIDPKVRQANAMMFGIADCVVASDPSGVHALIPTVAYTDAEMAALRRLKPTVAACLPAESNVTFDRGRMRAVMAETFLEAANVVNMLPQQQDRH